MLGTKGKEWTQYTASLGHTAPETLSLKTKQLGLEDRSAVKALMLLKRTCSQNPHGGSHPLVAPVVEALRSSGFLRHWMHMVQTYHRQYTKMLERNELY